MSVLTDFTTGLAQMIDTASIGDYDPSGYADDSSSFCVTFRKMPEAPTRIIAISCYVVQDDPELNDTMLGIQFRTRGTEDAASASDVDDALFNLFQGLRETTVNGVRLVIMYRQSSGDLGTDENDRHRQVSNYYAQIAWPTTHRLD